MPVSPSGSFFAWLSTQKHRQTEVENLYRAAVKDKTFPREAKKLHIFLDYYESEPTLREDVKMAHAVWRKWKSQTAEVNQ